MVKSRSNSLTAAYHQILKDNVPVLDVRSEGEFATGSLPSAINIPILNDAERHEVGICYKQRGAEAAVQLGQALVTGSTKQRRVDAWCAFADAYPNGVITCFRGGMRSAITQTWLGDAGIYLARVEGGTKAFRRFSLDTIKRVDRHRWIVVAGHTGVGKTRFLAHFTHKIDLECLANHRGSAFGALATSQPTPISFEHLLAQELLRNKGNPYTLLEDESRTIGSLSIPPELYEAMQQAPIVVLKRSLAERVQLTYDAYVRDSAIETLLTALARTKKRLGGTRYGLIHEQMSQAAAAKSSAGHHEWISNLLRWYYDPMYEYQLNKKRERVVYEGKPSEVREYLNLSYNVN